MSETFDLTVEQPRTRKPESRLDRLRQKLEADVTRPDVLIPVPARPGVFIKVSPNLEQTQLRSWRKQAGEGTKNDFDTTKFCTYVLAHTCRGIYLDDEEMFDDNDNPLTFASPEIKEYLQVDRPVPDGVKAMYKNDAHLEAAAMAVLEQAGYGDNVEAVPDPLAN